MTGAFPDFLQKLIDSPPQAGEGVHAWLFRLARQLHAHLTAPEIVRLLESRVANCGRRVPRSEIEAAVKNSIFCAWQPKGTAPAPIQTARWPALNQKARAAILKDGPGLADLWERSPLRIEHNEQHTEELIDQLFAGNPLLCCCGKGKGDFDTKPREDWRGELAGQQFIVPSPMSKIWGVTTEGKPSKHTLDATGPRRFLIVEFDGGNGPKDQWPDQHAALLLHLARYAALALAVHSGGKSLHGWFFLAGEPEPRIEKFFRYAVSLGADPATWLRSQFVRMPDGTRDNGTRQTVYFFSPNPRRFDHA